MVNKKKNSSLQLFAKQYIYHQIISYIDSTAGNHKKSNNEHKKFGGNIMVV